MFRVLCCIAFIVFVHVFVFALVLVLLFALVLVLLFVCVFACVFTCVLCLCLCLVCRAFLVRVRDLVLIASLRIGLFVVVAF
jgi:hypothetical protein